MSIRYLSFGRPLDAVARRRKLLRALAAAKNSGAQHFVISGDLTEIGTAAQYEAVADALHESGIAGDRFTLVPGNHDAYDHGQAWSTALEGPLKPFARHSAREAGKVVDLGSIRILPVDVSRHQHIARSAGELPDATAEALERRAADTGLQDRPLIMVQHHPPFLRAPGMQWIDGLLGGHRLMDLLRRFRNLCAMHGHLHFVVDKVVELGRSRIFGAPAVVDDKGSARVRMYELRDGMIESLGLVG
jgi:3',5'-cyclic AMP phosphodiesterase CpdA